MTKRPTAALLALTALLALNQCKTKDPPPAPPTDPLSLLPAETQTGQRTFGCLVNGQVWTPKGNNGTSNYSVYYEPDLAKRCVKRGDLSVCERWS